MVFINGVKNIQAAAFNGAHTVVKKAKNYVFCLSTETEQGLIFVIYIYFQAITFPLLAAVIKIVYWGGDFFFVYLWAFVVGFTLFMMIIYPEFIAPLFDKYTPLPEGELRTEIEQLAASIDFPLYKLFVVEGSKR